MPDLSEAPNKEAIRGPEVLEPANLTDVSGRVSEFTESLIADSAPTHSKDSHVVKELAEISLSNLNTILISNPALMADREVLQGVNDTLAKLDPDPGKPRTHRAVSEVDSPFGLAAAFDRAGIILREDMKSPEEHYRLIGRLASGSLRTLAIVNSRIKDIEDGLSEATAKADEHDNPVEYRLPVHNSAELDQELAGAIEHFTVVETKRNQKQPEPSKTSVIAS